MGNGGTRSNAFLGQVKGEGPDMESGQGMTAMHCKDCISMGTPGPACNRRVARTAGANQGGGRSSGRRARARAGG